MTIFDERFTMLQATKPLPLIPQPAARNPGPVQTAMADLFRADLMISIHQRTFAAAQCLLQRMLSEATHATPPNP